MYGGVSSLVMLDSLRPKEPTRFLCPWDFPGKNTEMGCHFLLQGTEPGSPALRALSCIEGGYSLPTEPPGNPIECIHTCIPFLLLL